ncbi:phospholipid phosphatase 1-like isoform X2 [Formica exsecta]|uniref:phospholipid phosphatase 1-like isoform X2 n=1 Tax=Formica exsecta TaxID=72781 RepID=UPI0011442ECF|nr:phospholipid phosphatase 1-like isoform X2 [Formica exsecta]
MQRSTEQLTRCSTITLTEEVAENISGVTATRTVSEKIMSVCRKTIRWIYIFDLVLALSVTVLLGILEFNVIPYQQIGFFCNDPKISFRFTGDTISMSLLIIFSVTLPIIVMWIAEYACHPADSYRSNAPNRNQVELTRNKQLWSWYSHYSIGLVTLTLVCEVMKVLIGEPRPHFLDTCKPREAANCTDEYISSYTCTNTEFSDWFVKDSSKSFPSGHSAISLYTSIFLVWYLQNRLPNRTLFLKPWLQCLTSMWAVTCSMTRVGDNRHHWWDVLAGNALGFLFGLFVVLVPCRHFCLGRIGADVVVVPKTAHALNEPLENGQIGSFEKQHQHSVKKLLDPAVVDISEGREMKDIAAKNWKE